MGERDVYASRRHLCRHAPSMLAQGLKLVGEAKPSLAPGRTYRYILGRDSEPAQVSPQEAANLNDPFAELILKRGLFPQTVREVLAMVDASRALPLQRSFLVADGGQIPWTGETRGMDRLLRVVITRSRTVGAPQDLLFISASPRVDSKDDFLQVISWDEHANVFNWYDRDQGVWTWAGNSWDALTPECRGKGPFDSHINGTLNMKELKEPWSHWHSMSARIGDDVLAPNDPFRTEPLFLNRLGAEHLEGIVRGAISDWNDARFAALTQSGQLVKFEEFARQVLGSSTVNLVSSFTPSRQIRNESVVVLPTSFFIDPALIDSIGLGPAISPISVPGHVYLEILEQYDVALQDGVFRFKGDSFFAFLVPERAQEDQIVLQKMLDLGVLSPRCAAALLMVDFPNPLFSERRDHLLRYLPAQFMLNDGRGYWDRFAAAVATSKPGCDASSPEYEFIQNWNLSEGSWRPNYEGRIEQFFQGLAQNCQTAQGFADVFRVAESRRREFRRRPLAEFRLTTPTTNIPEDAPLLKFTSVAAVVQKPLNGVQP